MLSCRSADPTSMTMAGSGTRPAWIVARPASVMAGLPEASKVVDLVAEW